MVLDTPGLQRRAMKVLADAGQVRMDARARASNSSTVLSFKTTLAIGLPASYSGVKVAGSQYPAGEQIELWPKLLTVGQPLPELPLALRNAMTLPVDLEKTYEEARLRSRLR